MSSTSPGKPDMVHSEAEDLVKRNTNATKLANTLFTRLTQKRPARAVLSGQDAAGVVYKALVHLSEKPLPRPAPGAPEKHVVMVPSIEFQEDSGKPWHPGSASKKTMVVVHFKLALEPLEVIRPANISPITVLEEDKFSVLSAAILTQLAVARQAFLAIAGSPALYQALRILGRAQEDERLGKLSIAVTPEHSTQSTCVSCKDEFHAAERFDLRSFKVRG